MNIICRKVEIRDIDNFNLLMDELSCRAKNIDLLKKNIVKSMERKDLYLMVAEDSDTGELLGSMYGLLCPDFCDDCKELLYIENVVTASKFRRLGVAKLMFEEMEKWAKSNNVNYAVLCSGMNRIEAHIFYNKIGYSEVKGFKKYL